MWSLSFTPLVPLPLLIGLAVLAALAAGAAIVLAGRSAVLRAVALSILAIALADPSLVFEDREPVKDVVPVVVDRSASNRLADRGAQTDAAVAEVERQLRGIPGIEPRVVELRDAQGSSDGTRLFEALTNSLSDVPSERVAGAIAITDGLAHDAPPNVEVLGLKAPHRRLFEAIDWSTERVAAQTLARAAEIGLPVEILPTWYDVDDRASLHRLVAEVLHGETPDPDAPPLHPAPATAAFLRDAFARTDLAARLDDARLPQREVA